MFKTRGIVFILFGILICLSGLQEAVAIGILFGIVGLILAIVDDKQPSGPKNIG